MVGYSEERQLYAYHKGVRSICVLSDSRLAVGYEDNYIFIWSNWNDSIRLLYDENTHDGVKCLLELSNNKLAAAYSNGVIIIWDLVNYEMIHILNNGHRRGTEINDLILIDNDRLASAGADHRVIIWNTNSWQILQTLNEHTGEVVTLKKF